MHFAVESAITLKKLKSLRKLKMNDKITPHKIEWNSNKIKTIWDYYSSNPVYEEKYFGKKAGSFVIEEIKKTISLSNAVNILDYSSGKGHIMAKLIPHLKEGQTISGCDTSDESRNFIINRFLNDQCFKAAYTADQLNSSQMHETFDLIIATEVIEHMNEHDLHEFFQISNLLLKTGGHLVLTTPNKENMELNETICPECGCIFHRWQHQRSWSPESLAIETTKHNFKTKTCKSILWAPKLIRTILNFLKPNLKDGIFYVGEK
jgi:cyclopropane fatty-acyl-phospholipid synthase-like methyltransferase